MDIRILKILIPIGVVFLLFGCATTPQLSCPVGTQDLPDCPPIHAVYDDGVNRLYESRTWQHPDEQTEDPIKLGKNAQIPINRTRAKLLDISQDHALRSLAAKIWMIDNAEHTVDMVYYIFKRDAVGYAILGALCNAVKRGVDVRIIVDSAGSYHGTHSELRALEACSDDAGFMRNEKGQISTKKARAQAAVFNAFSRIFTRFNRRSHDKLMVVDGHVPGKAIVMTGGRNISLAYYGIKADGTEDLTAYRDLEIVLRPDLSVEEEYSVGSASEIYFSILFAYKDNKRMWHMKRSADSDNLYSQHETYHEEQEKFRKNLKFIKSLPEIRKRYDDMPKFLNEDFRISKAILSHELGNLTSRNVVTEREKNLANNPNSIIGLMDRFTAEQKHVETIRIVSPYLFVAKYKDKKGGVTYDGKVEMEKWLSEHPNRRVEIITNSVLTSDNFLAQSIIDMDMAPRMLLTPELEEKWKSKLEQGEENSELIESEEWKTLIENPRIKIYQTGKLDSEILGKGSTYYGKLHAKFIVSDDIGFVGTTNLDYRSRLYNNEMGFFLADETLQADLINVFEELKAMSYLWGSPEWLQMRKELRAKDIAKGKHARKQRSLYRNLRAFGLHWQI